MFVQGVGSGPHGPEPVERGGADRGREIAVGPPAGAALLQVAAQPAGDGARLLVETRHRRGSFQGRAVEPAGHLDAGARHGGGPVADELDDPVHVRRRRHPRIDDRVGLFGHDVGQGAAGDQPDVQRDVGREAAHPLQIDDLGGHLVDRARPLVGLDAGVGGHAADDETEFAAALAGRLHAAAGQPRLEHEGGPAAPRLLLDQGARGAAATFLVRGPQHDDPPRGRRHLEQRPHRQQPQRNARLHVEDAGPEQAAVLEFERHARKLSDRPDGVEVAEQQHLALAAPELGPQVVAGLFPGQPGDGPPDRLQALLQLSAATIDRRLVVGRRLQARQRQRGLDGPLAARLAPSEHFLLGRRGRDVKSCAHRNDPSAAPRRPARRASISCSAAVAGTSSPVFIGTIRQPLRGAPPGGCTSASRAP